MKRETGANPVRSRHCNKRVPCHTTVSDGSAQALRKWEGAEDVDPYNIAGQAVINL